MLGFYENFPQTIHKTALFSFSISLKNLQQILTQTFHIMNKVSFELDSITFPSIPKCRVVFELGIADANKFKYLDDEEIAEITRFLKKDTFQVIDVFCAIRYYKVNNEKKTPLKFDYYLIRFLFNKKIIEMQIFHERGPRYVTPEDIVNFFSKKVNENNAKKILKQLESF